MTKQTKLTKAARGRDCTVRIPGVCNHNPETVVLAHYRMAGVCGTSMKPADLIGAWACSDCHDVIDGRKRIAADRDILRLWHLEGMVRTLDILMREGVIRA